MSLCMTCRGVCRSVFFNSTPTCYQRNSSHGYFKSSLCKSQLKMLKVLSVQTVMKQNNKKHLKWKPQMKKKRLDKTEDLILQTLTNAWENKYFFYLLFECKKCLPCGEAFSKSCSVVSEQLEVMLSLCLPNLASFWILDLPMSLWSDYLPVPVYSFLLHFFWYCLAAPF